MRKHVFPWIPPMRYTYMEQAIAADRKLRQVEKANDEYLRRAPLFLGKGG